MLRLKQIKVAVVCSVVVSSHKSWTEILSVNQNNCNNVKLAKSVCWFLCQYVTHLAPNNFPTCSQMSCSLKSCVLGKDDYFYLQFSLLPRNEYCATSMHQYSFGNVFLPGQIKLAPSSPTHKQECLVVLVFLLLCFESWFLKLIKFYVFMCDVLHVDMI